MDLRLHKKTVLITGGTSGIGEQTAYLFAREGANVIVTGRRTERGESVAGEISRLGVNGRYVPMDVSDQSTIVAAFDTLKREGTKLDVLIANAGREQPTTHPIADLPEEDMNAIIDTNLKGTWLTIKYGLPLLRQPGGSIIMVSTMFSLLGGSGLSIYSASKAAINGLTRQLATEQGPHGIRVNTVSPGPIETDMLNRFSGGRDMSEYYEKSIPLGRGGKPEDIADVMVYLASERASYVSGQVVAIDGGTTVKMPLAGLE